jgi:Cysteine synthase
MGYLYNNIVETVGRTPLVKLNRISEGAGATVAVKCEFFNPLGSVKDRIGKAMIEDAEAKGLLQKGMVIVEPTSGNTGIALAFVAAAKGYKLILTMPETMSLERRTLLAMLGADLVLTPGPEGMKGAIGKAEEILRNTPNGWMPQQFKIRPTRKSTPRPRQRRSGTTRTARSIFLSRPSAPAAPARGWARC